MSRYGRISETAVRCRELSGADWRVLTCISVHADASGRAWPSMETIAEMTGVRRQDVPRVIHRLERFQQLRCERGGGPNRKNLYVLAFEGEAVTDDVRKSADADVRKDADAGVRNAADVDVRKSASKMSANSRREHTKEQTNIHTSAGQDESAGDWFERFLNVYPDRGDHTSPTKPAREKFLAALKGGADPAVIVRGAENYRQVMSRYRGHDRQFVKQPANWLKDRLWEQYQAQPTPAQPKWGML